MPTERIALITGANQGVGLEVATKLAAHGVTVYVGSRDPGRGEAAAGGIGAGGIGAAGTGAAGIGAGATAIQLDVTDLASIAAAADRIRTEHVVSTCWSTTPGSRTRGRAA